MKISLEWLNIRKVLSLIIILLGSTYVKLVLSILLILPFIKVGDVLENSHISSNFLFNDSSIGNSS